MREATDLVQVEWAAGALADYTHLSPTVLTEVPAWAVPSSVGRLHSVEMAQVLLWRARRRHEAPGPDDELTVATARLALAMGHRAARTERFSIAAHCGIPLLAGHIVARAQLLLADDLLAPDIERLISYLWPRPAVAAPPSDESTAAAMSLHRNIRQHGDGGVPCLDDLSRAGRSRGAYACALRELLRRSSRLANISESERFDTALRTTLITLVESTSSDQTTA